MFSGSTSFIGFYYRGGIASDTGIYKKQNEQFYIRKSQYFNIMVSWSHTGDTINYIP